MYKNERIVILIILKQRDLVQCKIRLFIYKKYNNNNNKNKNKQTKKKNFSCTLTENPNDDVTMRSALRSLTDSDKRKGYCTIHPNKLNDYFAKIGKSLLPTNNACFNSSVIPKYCIPHISTNDVNNYFELKNKTSFAFGGIRPNNLKLSAPCIVESLPNLHNPIPG